MKIYEAAQAVLRDAGKPLRAHEIHRQIVSKELYAFGAKDAAAVVSQALRRKSIGTRGSTGDIFKRTGPNTYGLVEWTR